MAKKQRKKIHKKWLLIVLSIIVIGLFFYSTIKDSQKSPYQNITNLTSIPTKQQSRSFDDRYIPLTPTILPASQEGWSTFVYPDPNKKYTFEYPSASIPTTDKDRYSDWIIVQLDQIGGYSSCKINFSEDGNDKPWPGTVRVKDGTYGERKVRIETISNNNVPYTEFISFGSNAKDPFAYFQAFFPTENNLDCQRLVNQILSSLKFYY